MRSLGYKQMRAGQEAGMSPSRVFPRHQQAQEFDFEMRSRQKRSPRALALAGQLSAFIWADSLATAEERRAAEDDKERLWRLIESGQEVMPSDEQDIRERYALEVAE